VRARVPLAPARNVDKNQRSPPCILLKCRHVYPVAFSVPPRASQQLSLGCAAVFAVLHHLLRESVRPFGAGGGHLLRIRATVRREGDPEKPKSVKEVMLISRNKSGPCSTERSTKAYGQRNDRLSASLAGGPLFLGYAPRHSNNPHRREATTRRTDSHLIRNKQT
jgi:hypothetical protein